MDVTIMPEVFQTNVFGPAYISQVFLPLVEKSRRKIIVNVSSRGAHLLFPGCSGYQVSRFPQSTHYM